MVFISVNTCFNFRSNVAGLHRAFIVVFNLGIYLTCTRYLTLDRENRSNEVITQWEKG